MSIEEKIWWWIRGAILLGIGLVSVLAIVVFADPQRLAVLADKVAADAGLLARLVPPPLPVPEKVDRAHWLDQSWSPRERYWFHHASQGTATIPVPYDWFVELERAELAPFGAPGRLADIDYLRRFGFIPSPASTAGQSFDGKAPEFGYRDNAPSGVTPASAKKDGPASYPGNPDGLPVGFARLESAADPATRKPFPAQLGLTCAACHTGHLEYRNVSVRFDGGPGMLNLGSLEPAIALSIVYTLKVPGRFDRFAERIARRSATAWPAWNDKAVLRAELEETFNKIVVQKSWESQSNNLPHVEEGFGRLDALNRIGNQVFFENLLPENVGRMDAGKTRVPRHLAANFASRDAPVSYPPIWDTPTFLWAQYDASILNELVRNVGESLGVNARIDMTSGDANRHFSSTVDVANIVEMERMLRGTDPLTDNRKSFNGLAAPKWSDAAAIFAGDSAWRIDPAKADRGRVLYRNFCVECHRGPVRDAEFDRQWPDVSFWSETSPDRKEPNWVRIGDRSYFNVVQKPVSEVGTDKQQSLVLTERRVVIPPELGIHPTAELRKDPRCTVPEREALDASFGLALMAVVQRTIDKWLAENPVDADTEKAMRGPRPNCPNPKTFTAMTETAGATAGTAKIVAQYRARPLDGVWATAPYLHNGSVPTLRAMLTPQADRPKSFCVGSRQFDPKDVGLRNEVLPCAQGLTAFDTTTLGNSNRGHSFEGAETDLRKLPAGVFGRALTPIERDDLVEYLKTL